MRGGLPTQPRLSPQVRHPATYVRGLAKREMEPQMHAADEAILRFALIWVHPGVLSVPRREGRALRLLC